jgi:hypothetical protein
MIRVVTLRNDMVLRRRLMLKYLLYIWICQNCSEKYILYLISILPLFVDFVIVDRV